MYLEGISKSLIHTKIHVKHFSLAGTVHIPSPLGVTSVQTLPLPQSNFSEISITMDKFNRPNHFIKINIRGNEAKGDKEKSRN